MSKVKGNSFERGVCKLLSLWWNPGRDDVFWRSQSSGGRATQRTKKKQTTKGQYGDVCATDGDGEALTQFVTIELKRGYNRVTLSDLIDRPARSARQVLEQWIDKASEGAKAAGSVGWLIIHKRDLREPVVYYPHGLYSQLTCCGCEVYDAEPDASVEVLVRHHAGRTISAGTVLKISVTTLAQFLRYVTREHVEQIVSARGGKKSA